MDPWRERYSLKQICAFVTLSTGFQAPDEGTEKYRAEGTVLCVRGFVFLVGVCCLFEIGAGLSRVRMPPWVIACSIKRDAPTVFKCVWHVLNATLDQPGTAMQTRLRPGAQACTVSTRSGAVCVRGFVFLGVCCLFEIGAGQSRVSMPLWMIACSSIRGAPTVFKCVWHVLDATLDQPGTAMQTYSISLLELYSIYCIY